MFRIIKKWYFKIYHLFKLIGIFILCFITARNVYAEECTNLLLENPKWSPTSNNRFLRMSENGTTVWTFNLEEGKTYTIYFNNGDKQFQEYFKDTTRDLAIYNVNQASNTQDILKTETKVTFTYTGINAWGQTIRISTRDTTQDPFIENSILWLVEGDSICKEETPTPPAPTPDTTYSSFLTLYTNKIEYLANGFNENPYLKAMIGIIFSWVVLELFLKILHLRGGKYK